MMKTFILTSLLVALAYGSPLLVERQSCPASGISAARPAQVFSKFIPTRVIPDSVPELTPTTDLRIKYGNMNEDLDNEFTILRGHLLIRPRRQHRPSLFVQARQYVSLICRQSPNYTPLPLNLVKDVTIAPLDLQKHVNDGEMKLVRGNSVREGLGMTLRAVILGYTGTGEG
jgi:hypothetical protein